MIQMRDVRPEDKEMLRTWRNLPEVSKYMYTDHTIGPEEHEKWFTAAMVDPRRRYWIIQVDGEDVGLANLADIDRKNGRCYWAFYLASPSRGKGVGSYVEYFILQYVFYELGLRKLCGEVLGFNKSVLRMHSSFGFVEEGRLRQHVIKNGEPCDVVSIGIFRDEWEKVRPAIEERLRALGLLPANEGSAVVSGNARCD